MSATRTRRWMNLWTASCVLIAGACGPAMNAGAAAMTNIFFLHHSVGSGLIEGGSMRSVIAVYNSVQGTSFGLWDHGYNSDGLRDANGAETGINYAVPEDNTEPAGYAYLWTSMNADAVACRNQIMANHQLIAFKSCFTASGITDAGMLEAYKQNYLAMLTFFDQHPEKLFVAITPPPRHRLDTTAEQAALARQFANWLKSSSFLGGRTNVVCFDLFDNLAGTDNVLKYLYEESHTETDSHPNAAANQIVGPILAATLIASASAYQPGPTPPVPGNPAATVRANGSSGPVTLSSADTLVITVALNAGGYFGQMADWWAVVQASSDWYYFDYLNQLGWQPGMAMTLQAPLVNLPECEILNMSGLPIGTYSIYFGVDTVPDGQVSPEALYYSSVTVTVQ